MGLFFASKKDIIKYSSEFISKALDKIDTIDKLEYRVQDLLHSDSTNITNIQTLHENNKMMEDRIMKLEAKIQELEEALARKE